MNKHPKCASSLITAALILGLGCASPVFADDDHGGKDNENHSSGTDSHSGDSDSHSGGSDNHSGGSDNHSGGSDNHSGGSDNHSGGSDNHSGGSDNHSGGSDNHSGGSDNHSGNSSGGGKAGAIKAALSGTVQAGAFGNVKLRQQTRATRFEAELKLPIPADALAVGDRTAAESATLTLSLIDGTGVAYAECDFDLAKIKTKKRTGLTTAEYKIEVNDRRGNLQERFGTCDIDLSTAGVQAGVPVVRTGDTATVLIDTNNVVFLQGAF